MVVLAVAALVPWPPYYRQEPIHAQLLDKATNEPIAGAAVVAVWLLAKGGIEKTWPLLRYEEAVTDAGGEFHLSGWKHWRSIDEGRLEDEDPTVYIYKPGYKSLHLDNSAAYVPITGRIAASGRITWTPLHTPQPGQVAERYPGWRWSGAKRYCFWSGKAIGMSRARTPQDDLDALLVAHALDTFTDQQLPQFWSIWRSGRERLPEDFKKQIEPY